MKKHDKNKPVTRYAVVSRRNPTYRLTGEIYVKYETARRFAGILSGIVTTPSWVKSHFNVDITESTTLNEN